MCKVSAAVVERRPARRAPRLPPTFQLKHLQWCSFTLTYGLCPTSVHAVKAFAAEDLLNWLILWERTHTNDKPPLFQNWWISGPSLRSCAITVCICCCEQGQGQESVQWFDKIFRELCELRHLLITNQALFVNIYQLYNMFFNQDGQIAVKPFTTLLY